MISTRLLAALALTTALAAPAIAADFTDDSGHTATIPDHPARIVSLQDLAITIPLLELGVTPVGSHGRAEHKGTAAHRNTSI